MQKLYDHTCAMYDHKEHPMVLCWLLHHSAMFKSVYSFGIMGVYYSQTLAIIVIIVWAGLIA